jgi:hypothetical protein
MRNPVSVKLGAADWNDLINFVGGDLANMAYNDVSRIQMERILSIIREACIKQEK